ncbi:MAG: hypothetical protein HXY43_05700 [Fischerella sp.]|jgi:hypothetical protein|uniref:hypothetical protein n=1 Tax=Fischerella sp. TaxID=1191 RepID=UPI0017D36D14|nr:hypothetical protein [Fischerella sp.]NWF58803.1 hypothetical protein [Fischerella sp.]
MTEKVGTSLAVERRLYGIILFDTQQLSIKRVYLRVQSQSKTTTGSCADIEREFNLGWDQQLRSQIEKEYNNKPVLIVKGVYPSALPENAK